MKRQQLLTTGKLALAAALMLSASNAIAGIAATKHNLSNAGLGTQANEFSATGEICVFCHTPHGADTSAAVPLWNRVLDGTPATTYDTYNSTAATATSSIDGEILDVGSVSLACLSCHDGTQAMNVMINAPGSGQYDPTGFTLAGTFTGSASTATPVGSLNYGGNNIVNIGTDLTNDHPIGIAYGGGGITSGAPTAATNDLDFVAPLNQTINSKVVWWVDSGTVATSRDKADMQLYTRAGTGGDQPYVECASCHDPHTNNATFLRISNDGSAVCLACHVK